jgi:hypothetical protein
MLDITIARFNPESRELIIGGISKNIYHLTIEQRETAQTFFINHYKYDLEYNEDQFVVRIDLSILKDSFVSGTLCDVYLVSENEKLPVNLSNWPDWTVDAAFFENSNFQVQPYRNCY